MMNRSTYMNLKGSLLDSPLREYRLKRFLQILIAQNNEWITG